MEPLVTQAERRLVDGGLLVIAGMLIVRLLLLFALTRSVGLTPLHYIVGGILIASLNFGGLLLPRAYSSALLVLGVGAWTYAVSLAPWPFRLLYPPRIGAEWLVWTAVVLAALSFGLRLILTRRWAGEMRGHGYAWIEDWARHRSLRARELARRTLITLGYQRARQL